MCRPKYAIAVEIKGTKQPRLIFCGLRVYAAQRAGLHKKGNLERLVVRPEAHAMLPGIITAALVGKTECHLSHYSPDISCQLSPIEQRWLFIRVESGHVPGKPLNVHYRRQRAIMLMARQPPA